MKWTLGYLDSKEQGKRVDKDIPAIRHFCTQKPDNIIVEKQMLGWHIHRTDIPHSKYRVDLKDNICTYCHRELPINQMYQKGEIQ